MPELSTPVSAVGLGTVRPASTGAVLPVRWSWRVTTPSLDGGAAASVTSKRAVAKAVAGATRWTPTAFRAYAVAIDGSVVSSYARAYSKYATENSSRTATYSNGWVGARTSIAMGGSLRVTAKRGAAVSTTVSGRSIGVLLARGARYGKVAVYLDGVRVAVLNQHATGATVQVAWSTSFATSGTHTLRLVNLTGGSAGGVGFDGTVSLA